LYAFFVEDKGNPLYKQTLGHHIVGMVGLTNAISTGYSYPGISLLSLLCEISTFFLNYRSMYTKEELSQPLPMVNQLLFFFTYTLLRIIAFPYIMAFTAVTTWTIWGVLPWYRKLTSIFTILLFTSMILLNLFWYILILKGVKKLLQSKGIINSEHKEDRYENAV
jgi:hypothetical protein